MFLYGGLNEGAEGGLNPRLLGFHDCFSPLLLPNRCYCQTLPLISLPVPSVPSPSRVRPLQDQNSNIISFPLEGMLAIAPLDRRPQEFEFDHVFTPEAGQQAVYDEVWHTTTVLLDVAFNP